MELKDAKTKADIVNWLDIELGIGGEYVEQSLTRMAELARAEALEDVKEQAKHQKWFYGIGSSHDEYITSRYFGMLEQICEALKQKTGGA